MTAADRDLTQGAVRRQLFRMAWPMTVGIAATMSVSIADTYFLGRLGTQELAAISYTFPVVLTLMSLAIGLGAGTASVVSRAIGRDDVQAVRRVSTDALILCVVIVAALSLAGFFAIRPLFSMLGASGAILDLIEIYMRIWYAGLPALAVMMVCSNLLRSGGDARTPSMVMIGIALINVILDPMLIFGFGPIPAMGMEGAAWASFVARYFALFAALGIVVFRDRLLTLETVGMAQRLKSWRRVAVVAVPAAFGNAVNPLGIAIVTGLIAGFGDEIVAGFGVATRIESFVTIPMLALSAAIGPISGQNWGAGQTGRVRSAHRLSFLFAAGWSIAMAALLFVSAGVIASLFSSDPAVVETAAFYLRIVPVSLAGYGITVVAAGGFNAIGRPLVGLCFYLLRTAFLYVPLAFAGASVFGTTGAFAGIAIANIVAAIAVAFISLWALSRTFPDSGEMQSSHPGHFDSAQA